MIKEVMKLSELEYQKDEGKIDLSHLKRKKYKETLEGNSYMNGQQKVSNKVAAPKTLVPVILGNAHTDHINSTNTMGI